MLVYKKGGLMKNFIQIGETQVDLDAVGTAEDLDKITGACINIMGFVMMVGTSGIKDDKKRVEAIMNQSGKIGGAMARQALVNIANEKNAEEKKPQEGGQPDA